LTVIARGRRVEVFVDGVEACPPLSLDLDLRPTHVQLAYTNASDDAVVEFERLTVWEPSAGQK
jgi:hypothetical protein